MNFNLCIRKITLVLFLAALVGCNKEKEEITTGPEGEVKLSLLTTGEKTLMHGEEMLLVQADKPELLEKVNFYAGDQLIATVEHPPYEISWNTTAVEDGVHTLKAEAIVARNSFTATLGVEVSNNLLLIEADPGYYGKYEEWFYLATPEGELLTEPVKAENGRTVIKRPKGYLKNVYQLYFIKARVAPGVFSEFHSYVYTDFPEKIISRKVSNSREYISSPHQLTIIREPYTQRESFYLAASIWLQNLISSSDYTHDSEELKADFWLLDDENKEFYVFSDFDDFRWTSGYSYLKVNKVEGQTAYAINKADFKRAEKSFTLTLEEAEMVGFRLRGINNGYIYHIPGVNPWPGQAFTRYYPGETFSNYAYSANWTKGNHSFAIHEQGIPVQQFLKPLVYASSVSASSPTDFTYHMSKEADVAITDKSYYESTSGTYHSIQQRIFSPAKNGSFKIAPLPAALLDTYPMLKRYSDMKYKYTDFRDFKNIASYADYVHAIYNPAMGEVDYWGKFFDESSQTIYNHGSEGARKVFEAPAAAAAPYNQPLKWKGEN